MEVLYTYAAKHTISNIVGFFKYYKYELKGQITWRFDEYLVDVIDNKINNEDVCMNTGFNKNYDIESLKQHLRTHFSHEQIVSKEQWHELKNNVYLNVEMSKHMVN